MRIPKATRKKVAALIATGKTQRDAANEAGITEVTVCHWMADPVFRAEVDAGILAESEALRTRLRSGMDRAVQALLEVLDCDNATAKARAAIALLEAGGYLKDEKPRAEAKVIVEFGDVPELAPETQEPAKEAKCLPA